MQKFKTLDSFMPNSNNSNNDNVDLFLEKKTKRKPKKEGIKLYCNLDNFIVIKSKK